MKLPLLSSNKQPVVLDQTTPHDFNVQRFNFLRLAPPVNVHQVIAIHTDDELTPHCVNVPRSLPIVNAVNLRQGLLEECILHLACRHARALLHFNSDLFPVKIFYGLLIIMHEASQGFVVWVAWLVLCDHSVDTDAALALQIVLVDVVGMAAENVPCAGFFKR